ncbi:Uncharacterized protein PBTT_07289 [Plasmodiophora brassicae]|nr:hypothetical protein PBRA_008591 [Plasmodiophora brassicae]
MTAPSCEVTAPPYSLKVKRINGQRHVVVRVVLHRVPPHHIKYEPTQERLVVTTLGHTKKFVLDVPYPDGVRVVVGDNPEAQFEYGILTAQLPIEGEVARPPRDKPEKRAKSPPAAPVAPVKPAKVKKPKKPFVVKDTALKLVDEIAGAEERAVEEKLAKDAEKQTALEQRSAERAEKEERRQKFKAAAKAELKARISRRRAEQDEPCAALPKRKKSAR